MGTCFKMYFFEKQNNCSIKFVTQISGGVSMHPTSDFGHAYAATVQNLANKECKSRLSQA